MIQTKLDSAIAEIKTESQCKDDKICALETTCQALQKRVTVLEDSIDATEAYERRDTVILSGAMPPSATNEDIKAVTVDLINGKFPDLPFGPNDISICHRLQAKRPSRGSEAKPPNIYVKLVRRDMKQMLIKASKGQPKEASNKVFANESLTQQRSAVLQTLLNIKKEKLIKGVTSQEGQVYAFIKADGPPPPEGGNPRDIRYRINTRRELQAFCDQHVRQPLEDFINHWPEQRV